MIRVVLVILKIVSFLLVLLMVSGVGIRANADFQPPVSAEACVLMYEDGTCIYEKNPDDKKLIASTTKLMTAIVALENSELNDKVKIKEKNCNVEGSSMYLKPGSTYTVKELLLGLLLASGNDAALSLAEHVSGNNKEFAALMNEKAKELGMDNSSFSNPHGLDERGHYSSARDLAKLMLYCMQNEDFRALVSTYHTTIKDQSYTNHNRLLKSYPGCVGGKTGFTSAAGRCLVSCVEKDGIRLVCVTLSAPDDWQDHRKLYDYAFAHYSLRDVTAGLEYQVPLISGNKKSISVIPGREIKIFLENDVKVEIKAVIPSFVFPPLKMGETVGEICVIINNNVVEEIPLVYAENAVMAFPA